jgi:hypothetical protein
MATDVLYIDNTNNAWLEGLTNDVNDVVINDATCTILYVLDNAGAQVSGTVNISMTYKTGSAGNYYGKLPHTVTLTENAEYTVCVKAVTTDDDVGVWRRKVRAVYRNI